MRRTLTQLGPHAERESAHRVSPATAAPLPSPKDARCRQLEHEGDLIIPAVVRGVIQVRVGAIRWQKLYGLRPRGDIPPSAKLELFPTVAELGPDFP